ncbi:hypothetical protein EQG63_11205 [Flavobacterium amnicola]|uniref:Uncharacterized protein n=1 Tax=Flavobacterium amnicola TaxID=2506422 RepID=A0A4Q1K3M4_9FLAO|nr:hypothetical protein [Flavobacterium amnicola]RXR17348.1 hypothetical protein EQG63_11205 [Flavobacterium amnicola]
MIISKDSYLRRPPKKLNAKQASTFNAITYSVDICNISYERLHLNLLNIEENLKTKKYIYSEFFLDAWSIINSSTVFLNLITRHFKEIDNSDLIEIKKAKKIRNTNQHLDERVEEVFMLKNLPIYGSLSWRHNLSSPDECNLILLSAGIFTHHDTFDTYLSPGISSGKEIENIMLRSVERKKNDFEDLSVCLDKLIEELKVFVLKLEAIFTEQIEREEGTNDVERHGSNIFILFPRVKVTES